MSISLIYYFPMMMVAAFFACMAAWSFPGKGRFILQSVCAATVAVLISHLNRLFDWYPSHPYFPSGHMTLCLSVALSLSVVRPWTLAITLPLLVYLGFGLVVCGFHAPIDVLGAVPLVLLVYAIAFHKVVLRGFRPLDSRAGSH